MEDNMRNALISMLVLNELAHASCSINEICDDIEERSNGNIKIGYPYQPIYRLMAQGAVVEVESHIARDGRRRKCYSITEYGRKMLAEQVEVYRLYSKCTDDLLHPFGYGNP